MSTLSPHIPFSVTVLTLFPELFPGPLGASVLGVALKKGLWNLTVVNIRDFVTDKHRTVDGPGFGGGPGMVMRPDILDRAIAHAVEKVRLETSSVPRLAYLSPRGKRWNQNFCCQWAEESRPIILLCGRFEGVDQRVLDFWNFEEFSLGDFVLAGGEIPAMALIEGCVRLIEGVVGDAESLIEESFQGNLLEYPHYTRPRVWRDMSVPEILVSGNHAHVRQWRLEQARVTTQKHRPDLWTLYCDSVKKEVIEKTGEEDEHFTEV